MQTATPLSALYIPYGSLLKEDLKIILQCPRPTDTRAFILPYYMTVNRLKFKYAQKICAVAEHGVKVTGCKKGTSKDLVSISNLSIINQLKELRKELTDEQLFAEIKDELLGDSIFVFTPKGDVRELPAGSLQ